MKPITLGMKGAMSSLVALPMAITAQAAATPQAQSFSELLDPIPDASARLQTADLQESGSAAKVIPAAYYYRWVRERVYYHPRYVRHHYRRRYYYGYRYYYGPPAWPYVYYHHHHHHHHHHSFY